MENAVAVIKAVESKNQAKAEKNAIRQEPPTGGDTAFYPNEQGNTYQLDPNTPTDQLSAPSKEQLIDELNKRAKQGDPTAKRALSQLGKKLVNRGIDFEYNGKSTLDLVRELKEIKWTDSEEIKAQKEAYNLRLQKSRSNWTPTKDY
jgi:hypothetical protein